MELHDIHIEARIYRNRLFGRRRYCIHVFADNIDTGLSFDKLTKHEATAEAALIASDPVDVLDFHGLRDQVYGDVYAKRGFEKTGAFVGDWITLSLDFSGWAKGKTACVTRIDLDSAHPVVAHAPGIAGVIPLAVGEYEVIGGQW